jgi:phage-related protein
VTFDPLSSSQPLPYVVDVLNHERQNDCLNPSFETNTAFWGSDAGVTTTRLASSTEASKGTYSLKVNGTTANTGIFYGTTVSHMPQVVAGDEVFASFDAKTLTGYRQVKVELEGFDEEGASTGVFATKTENITTGWWNISLTGTIPPSTTRWRPRIRGVVASYEFVIDNVLMESSDAVLPSFDGDTSLAVWNGVAGQSSSNISAPTLRIFTPYVGDNNENNNVSMRYRHIDDVDGWITPQVSSGPDRDLKRFGFVIGPAIPRYNLCQNPSFEVSTKYWTGGTRTPAQAAQGTYSLRTSGGNATHVPLATGPSQKVTLEAMVMPDPEVSVIFRALQYTSTGSLLTEAQSTSIYGDGATWQKVSITFTTNASGAFIVPRLTGNGEFFVDKVQINYGDPKPYRDGSLHDGIWEGNMHESSTGLQILNDTDYLVETTFVDPEGFFDTHDGTSLTYSEIVHTPIPPDNATTVSNFVFTSEQHTIDVSIPYQGDDNEDNKVRIEFKREDLTSWVELRPTYDRYNKVIRARAVNLASGTAYTFRAIFDDPDGVLGVLNRTMIDTESTDFPRGLGEVEPSISFGGFMLMGRDDQKILVTEHDAFGFPERRVDTDDIPRLDGSVELQSLWGKREINMSGVISGDSRDDLAEIRDSLARALSPRQQRLVIESLTNNGRYYYATCSKFEITEDKDSIRHLEWDATFTCADPFAYDIEETIRPTFRAVNDSTIAWQNDGAVSTHPYLKITTSSAYPLTITIHNTTTGELLTPTGTIINGDRLIIDSSKVSLTKNGVEIDYTGLFPELAIGGNIITFRVLALTAPASFVPQISVDARWRNKHL